MRKRIYGNYLLADNRFSVENLTGDPGKGGYRAVEKEIEKGTILT